MKNIFYLHNLEQSPYRGCYNQKVSAALSTNLFFFREGLFFLFNGISTFAGYLMPKPFS